MILIVIGTLDFKPNFKLSASLLIGLLLFCFPAFSQNVFYGSVSNQDGEPLTGANIYLPELEKGTTTNNGGYFDFGVLPAGQHAVEISYIGYQTLELTIDGSKENRQDIVLLDDPIFTGEIIVSATRADARTPMTYSTVNKNELETNNLGQDVPFLLRWTPSTVVTSDAGTGIGYTG
ncbi:MAG: carboxypeptidase-like regulatory domain-containing protein, partial [Bacteroidota bacterium]